MLVPLVSLRSSCVRVFGLCAIALSCIVAGACSTPPRTDVASASPESDRVFVFLGALGNLLDFPADQARLDACVAEKDEKCLALHAQFHDAVRQLFSDGSAQALKRTLAVEAHCKSPTPPPSELAISRWQRCRGAVVAFYFFSSDEEDRKILNHLSALEPAILQNAFVESKGYAGDWVYNRPDRQRWIAFMRSVSVLRDERIAEVFSGSKPSSGIALLVPAPVPRETK
jgi:hypothetical protein